MRSVINLVKTNNGYSLMEGETLLNKTGTKTQRDKPLTVLKKPVQNFTIYPYIGSHDKEANRKFVILPARSQWFSINAVHEMEKKALPEWFRQKKVAFGTVKQEKFQKNEDLYKKYRNHIIQLGKDQYVSAYQARRGLAGDASSIIRIHDFLEKWGLINYVYQKPNRRNNKNGTHVSPINIEGTSSLTSLKPQMLTRKDCFEKDKSLASKQYNKEDLDLLKKITKQVRVFCHYCEGVCGAVWFEYEELLYLKQFSLEGISKVSQSYDYILRLCAHCYHDGNIPIVLSMNNFVKKTILDGIDSVAITAEVKEPKENTRKGNKILSNGQKSANGEGSSTKLIDNLEKNKLNFKKASEELKITESTILKEILNTPIKKLQKLKKVQLETDSQGEANEQDAKTKDTKLNFDRNLSDFMMDEEKSHPIPKKIKENEEDELAIHITRSEKIIYEEFIQSWVVLTGFRLQKLEQWDRSVNWTYNQNRKLQQQTLANQLRNIQMK